MVLFNSVYLKILFWNSKNLHNLISGEKNLRQKEWKYFQNLNRKKLP